MTCSQSNIQLYRARKLFATPGITWIFSEVTYPYLAFVSYFLVRTFTLLYIHKFILRSLKQPQFTFEISDLEGVFVTSPVASPPNNPLYDEFMNEISSVYVLSSNTFVVF